MFARTSMFALPCFILYSKPKLVCYSGCLLTSYFCISIPYDERIFFFFAFQSPMMKRTPFLMLVLEGVVLIGLHITGQPQLLQHQWVGQRLGLLWYWMVCLGNEQRSFCPFWDFSKYCISDSFVDYDGYSYSSKGFFPTVVDIMVMWVKFTHSSPGT